MGTLYRISDFKAKCSEVRQDERHRSIRDGIRLIQEGVQDCGSYAWCMKCEFSRPMKILKDFFIGDGK